MKIAIIQGACLPVPALRGGAVEKIWHGLGLEFAARGHTVTHLSRRCDGLPARERLGGVDHIRVRGYDQPRNPWLLKTLDLLYTLRVCRQVPPSDVVVTNTFWAPLLLRRRCGAVYVDVQRMPRGQMRLYRRAARLRANSAAVREAILREVPAAAPRVAVIPNPLPTLAEGPVPWAEKSPAWLYAGRLHPEKGIELLLQAFTRLRAAGQTAGWSLELVGPDDPAHGGGGAAWANRLRREYPDPAIRWRGPLFDPAELNRAYAHAGAFVYPSLAERGETFGAAVLEAMAWGNCPVVSDLACFRDFVLPGRNGLVFNHRSADPAAALARAMIEATGPAGRRLGEAATAVRQTHSLPVIAQQFLADFAAVAPSPLPS